MMLRENEFTSANAALEAAKAASKIAFDAMKETQSILNEKNSYLQFCKDNNDINPVIFYTIQNR